MEPIAVAYKSKRRAIIFWRNGKNGLNCLNFVLFFRQFLDKLLCLALYENILLRRR